MSIEKILGVFGIIAGIVAIANWDKPPPEGDGEGGRCTREQAKAHVRYGNSRLNANDPGTAGREFRRARDCSVELDDRYGEAVATLGLSRTALQFERLGEAQRLAQQGLSLARSARDEEGAAFASMLLGDIARRAGNRSVACSHWQESLRILHAIPASYSQDLAPRQRMNERLVRWGCAAGRL